MRSRHSVCTPVADGNLRPKRRLRSPGRRSSRRPRSFVDSLHPATPVIPRRRPRRDSAQPAIPATGDPSGRGAAGAVPAYGVTPPHVNTWPTLPPPARDRAGDRNAYTTTTCSIVTTVPTASTPSANAARDRDLVRQITAPSSSRRRAGLRDYSGRTANLWFTDTRLHIGKSTSSQAARVRPLRSRRRRSPQAPTARSVRRAKRRCTSSVFGQSRPRFSRVRATPGPPDPGYATSPRPALFVKDGFCGPAVGKIDLAIRQSPLRQRPGRVHGCSFGHRSRLRRQRLFHRIPEVLIAGSRQRA